MDSFDEAMFEDEEKEVGRRGCMVEWACSQPVWALGPVARLELL